MLTTTPQRNSIGFLLAGYIGEMRTQSIHDKGRRLVPRTVRRNKVMDVDKDPQTHSIEISPAGYTGRDEDTRYPRQRRTVSQGQLFVTR